MLNNNVNIVQQNKIYKNSASPCGNKMKSIDLNSDLGESFGPLKMMTTMIAFTGATLPTTIKSATNEIFNSHKFRLLAIDEGEGITLGVPLDGFRIYTCRIENDFSPTPAMAPLAEQVFLQIRRFSIEIDDERLELGLPVQVLQQLGGLDQTASLSQPINDD